MKVIHTIGHSVRSSKEFIVRLKENDIDILVDVRSTPYSRFNPQYNKQKLDTTLAENNIIYQWRGNNLGGKGKNVDYEETIDEFAKLAKRGKQICIMCSEGDYKKCHRYEMLEPSFVERGIKIEHIIYEKKSSVSLPKR